MTGQRKQLVRLLLLAAVIAAAITGCADVPSDAPPAPSIVATNTAPSVAPSGSALATEVPTPTSGPPQPAPPTAQPAPPAPVASGVALPDPRLTPGETFTGVTVAQVCTPGYSSRVRHVTLEQYHEVYAEYGIPYPEPSGTYELDHLIPLELGGDNANANLWPEPASPVPGFHQKDDLENRMHDLVCSGQLALAEAQREIASDWFAAYRRYVGG